jgi:TnpA family transposase
MPRRTVLSTSQRSQFEILPTQPQDLTRHYTLTDSDHALIRDRRGEHNRLGFALQLCLLRYPGRLLRSDEDLPPELIDFVAEQVRACPATFAAYALRDETRREHQLRLRQIFKFQNLSAGTYRDLVRWTSNLAMDQTAGVVLVGAILNELRRRRILQPPLPVVDRIAATALRRAERIVSSRINDHLTDKHRVALDGLLERPEDASMPLFTWLQKPAGHPAVTNVLKVIERLEVIRGMCLPADLDQIMPGNRFKRLAREGLRASVHHIRQFEPARRHAVVCAALTELARSLVDEAITMNDKLLGSAIRKSQHRHAEALQDRSKILQESVHLLSMLGQALIEARAGGVDPFAAIEEMIPWDQLEEHVKRADELSNPKRFDPLDFLERRYQQIRRYAPRLLEHFDFQTGAAGKEVIEAVVLLRKLNQEKKRSVPMEDAPTEFVTPRWAPYVFQEGKIDRRYYELCVLSALRDRLRAGDVWLPESRQYQDFESYLVDKGVFAKWLDHGELPLSVRSDWEGFFESRRACLEKEFEEVDRLAAQNDLQDVTVSPQGLSIKPIRTDQPPEAVKRFVNRVTSLLPRIKITDLLLEVDQWTGFSSQFTHLRTTEPAEDRTSLLTVILADAINLGLTKMAVACPGASLKRLRWTSDWLVREEAYSRALAEIVNRHNKLPLAARWGEGTTSSSDGQHYPSGGVRDSFSAINPRYGKRPGVMFYTHISDQYSPFHTQVINATVRDATYVLDGLLYHESDLKIEEHYTDTSGFTDHVFALCHLLGFRFAPRIRDMGDRRLYVPGAPSKYRALEPLVSGKLDIKLLQRNWHEVLRLATSIQTGTVTASLILRKLGAYPRQNTLATALRELGRMERTLFMLEWLKTPALRIRVTAELNKGEARNALARAVFFNRLGEVRDRSFENQRYRASGLNLVVAAIVLWNTIYLERTIQELRDKGEEAPDEYLQYLSPLGWEHINLTGDYVWRDSTVMA